MMERIFTTCLELWQSCVESFSTTNLQLGLLIGSGVLAIALLVLAMTQWGQSRPVWKCVILSFGAHILLLGYAYGTHLIFEGPAAETTPDPLKVNLVEDFGETISGSDELDAETEPWENFASETPLPDVEKLERPLMDSEVVIERTEPTDEERPSTAAAAELPNAPLADVLPPQDANVPVNDFSALSIEDPIPAPPEIEFVRRDQDQEAQPQTPEMEPTLEDLDRPDMSNELSPIEKVNPSLEIADSIQSSFVGDLINRDSELPLAQPDSMGSASPVDDVEFREIKSASDPPTMRLASSPRRLADGQPMPKLYSLRNATSRLEVARKRGGSKETEQAVNLALRWLATVQQDDGRWDSAMTGGGRETKVFGHDRKGAGAEADCGITALATLAFLAAGHTHLEGPYQNEIQKALEFLVRQQKQDGSLSGNARLFARMYCHSMSLLALSEALAITGDQRLYHPVQRGVDYSIRAQNRLDGGWRYQPGDAGDMSQFGWQVLALHSAKIGGAIVPQSTFDRMASFLDQCSSGVGNGLASYRPGQGPSTTMTAEALLCRYFLNDSVGDQTLMEATRRIGSERPTTQQVNLYYWYYGTLALYHAGGTEWERWNEKLKSTLLEMQIQSGTDAGAWPTNGLWAGYGGQVYSTAMACLNLEVYYRYLPLYDIAENARPVESKIR